MDDVVTHVVLKYIGTHFSLASTVETVDVTNLDCSRFNRFSNGTVQSKMH